MTADVTIRFMQHLDKAGTCAHWLGCGSALERSVVATYVCMRKEHSNAGDSFGLKT